MFEVTEIISSRDFDIKKGYFIAANETSELSITTEVKELIFGNIKITQGAENELLIEALNDGDDKALLETFANKSLYVMNPGPPKTRPGDPAGTLVPPRVVIRPKKM